jgi:opine dehydrogenase
MPAVAVCGGGHGALATAADLALRGFEVRLALRNRRRFAELFDTGRVRIEGAGIEGTAELAEVSDDHAAVAAQAELVLVPLPAYAQESIAERIAPALRQGQIVCLLPGTFGSWVVAQVLRRHGVEGVLLAEAATLPYGARVRSAASVGLAIVAHHLPTGVYPAEATGEAVERLQAVYPAVEPVEDVLSAGLLNSNGALHAPLVALNAVPLERGPYDIHREGTTAGVRRVISALDGERVALREALGYGPGHWPLDDYYADRDWFYGPGAFTTVQERSVWREPLGLDHRYVREDVACGLALWSSLGRRLDVPTPLADAFLALFSALTGEDLRAGGRTLERLGLADVPLETLREWLRRGRP